MKKLYFSFLVVLFFFQFLFILNNQVISDSDFVFMEQENFSHDYYLSFENMNVTSTTLDKLFSFGFLIHSVYPKNQLSIIDDTILSKLNSFSYESKERLEKDYKNILQEYGLDLDIEKVNQYGVVIDKVRVQTTSENLKKLLEQYPDVTYSYYLNGTYQ